jgi:hypothetical protein
VYLLVEFFSTFCTDVPEFFVRKSKIPRKVSWLLRAEDYGNILGKILFW